MSDFYLSAFLAQLRSDGYSIFCVKGKLPPPLRDASVGGEGTVYPVSDLERRGSGSGSAAPRKITDDDLTAALAASMVEAAPPAVESHATTDEADDGDEDEDFRLAMALSLSEEAGS